MIQQSLPEERCSSPDNIASPPMQHPDYPGPQPLSSAYCARSGPSYSEDQPSSQALEQPVVAQRQLLEDIEQFAELHRQDPSRSRVVVEGLAEQQERVAREWLEWCWPSQVPVGRLHSPGSKA